MAEELALEFDDLPFITVVALHLPAPFAGSVAVEVIFSWPGMGRLYRQAAQLKDYPLLMAVIPLGGLFVVAANPAADVPYAVVDPRIRYGEERARGHRRRGRVAGPAGPSAIPGANPSRRERAPGAFLRAFRRHRPAAWSLTVLAALALGALLAPWSTPHGPTDQDLAAAFRPPSLRHPMGTDALGRDLLTRILYGTASA